MFSRRTFLLGAAALPWALGACRRASNDNGGGNRVVLYCSVDDVYARPLVARLERQTGLRIDALYDTEATKTAGLTNRIRAERDRPRADVFWSSALLQTLLLSEDGLLEAHQTRPDGLPERFIERDWAGVGVRGRVLVASDPEKAASISDLLHVSERDALASDRVSSSLLAHSNPQFGTASDQMAALEARQGGAALTWTARLQAGGLRVLPGNGDVARAVADGQIDLGWTDTDDFLAQKRAGKPIFVAPTRQNNVLVPGAVSLVRGAPRPENARRLFEAIAAEAGETALIREMPGVFSLRHLERADNWTSGGQDFGFLATAPADDHATWPDAWRAVREPLAQTLR